MDGSGKTPATLTEGEKVDVKSGEAADSGEGLGSCLKRTRGFIPLEYRNELTQLFKLAGPVVRLLAHAPTHQCIDYPLCAHAVRPACLNSEITV